VDVSNDASFDHTEAVLAETSRFTLRVKRQTQTAMPLYNGHLGQGLMIVVGFA
jgi:transketolase N-terminal domain/subunit